MDNSLKTKEKPPGRGWLTPPAKGKTKTFLIGKELKTTENKRLTPYRGGIEQADRQQTPTQNPRIAHAERRVKPPARLLRCATALRVTAPLGCGSRRLGRDGQRRAARCLSDSSARSWSSAASVSPAPRRGPARFPRPILDTPVGRRVARGHLCAPRQPARGHHRAALRRTILFGGAADRTRRAARAHP